MGCFRRARAACPACQRVAVRDVQGSKEKSVKVVCTCGATFEAEVDHVWWISFRVEGRVKRRKIGPDHKLALRAERKAMTEIAAGKIDLYEGGTMRLSALADAYWKHLRATRRRPEMVKGESSEVSGLLEHLGDPKLRDIKTRDVEAWAEQAGSAAVALKPATVAKRCNILGAMLTWAVRQGWLHERPKMPSIKFDNRVERFLTREQVAAIVALLPDDDTRDVIRFLACTGMRRGEACGLTWAMLDMGRKTASLPAILCKSNRPRSVPLNPSAVEVLERRLEVAEAGEEHVFTHKGRPIVPGHLTVTFIRAATEAGCKCRLHDLRHTFASWLVQAGVPLYDCAALLGHKDVSVTLRYAHLQPEGLALAVAHAGLDGNPDTGPQTPTETPVQRTASKVIPFPGSHAKTGS